MGNVNIINSGLSEKVSESQSDTGKIQNAGALMKTSVRQTHPHILSVKKKEPGTESRNSLDNQNDIIINTFSTRAAPQFSNYAAMFRC